MKRDEDPRVELIAPHMHVYHQCQLPMEHASPSTQAGRRKMARYVLELLDSMPNDEFRRVES